MGITVRDVGWLSWMARWKGVTAEQIVGAVGRGVPVRSVVRRLGVWREEGLVESAAWLVRFPRVHWLTRRGLDFVGVTGPVVKPRLETFRHDLMVVDLAVAIMGEVEGVEFVTEREIKQMESAGGRGFHVEARYSLDRPDEPGRRIFPDLVSVHGDGAVWGHELELSRKTHRRLVRLMCAYVGAADRFTAVRYYAAPGLVGVIRGAAAEANQVAMDRGLGKRISVVEVEVPEYGG